MNKSDDPIEKCMYRCLIGVGDYEIKIEEWMRIDFVNGANPGCDIVDIECISNSKKTYKFIHANIVEVS